MNARKLNSGNYRARAYDYTDAQGKKHYQSFTAPTKREAERLANEFLYNKERSSRSDLTVGEAIDGYINAKENVLSPSTIRGYRAMQRKYYKKIEVCRISKLTSVDLQEYVSSLSEELSPKTVSNIYGLLSSSLALYLPDRVFRVTLPSKVKPRAAAPSDDDVKTLFSDANEKLKISIALAAFGSMRRGEICAVKYKDLTGNMLYVHADIVQAADCSWIYKEMPKTEHSIRHVMLPDSIVSMIGEGDPEDFIVDLTPGALTNAYRRLAFKHGVHIRFHDLRHYFASIGAILGIPDIYMSDFGGWRRGSSVLKEVYQNNITSMSELYARKMSDHFEAMVKDV